MAAILILIVETYLGLGLLVAAVFLLWGIETIDAEARAAYSFRPLLIPGVVLIWPLVLWRWRQTAAGVDAQSRHRPPRRFQHYAGFVLAVAILITFFAGLLLRQNGPLEREAIQIAPPAQEQE